MVNQGLLELHGEMIKRCSAITYSEFGGLLAVAGAVLNIYDAFKMTRRYTLQLMQNRVSGLAFGSMDHTICVHYRTSQISVYYFEEGFEKVFETGLDPGAVLSYYSEENDLLAVCLDWRVCVFTDRGKLPSCQVFIPKGNLITSFLLVKELNLMMVGSRDGILYIFSLTQSEFEQSIRVLGCPIEFLGISEELKSIIVAGQQQMALVSIFMLKEGDLFVSD